MGSIGSRLVSSFLSLPSFIIQMKHQLPPGAVAANHATLAREPRSFASARRKSSFGAAQGQFNERNPTSINAKQAEIVETFPQVLDLCLGKDSAPPKVDNLMTEFLGTTPPKKPLCRTTDMSIWQPLQKRAFVWVHSEMFIWLARAKGTMCMHV